ncbi:MAG TPA: hypothetical protein VHK01_03195 [Lacipirellulaceae bacterium]|jgi:hypothetical protein|nr:hypothetical protein [Lacipirellulaceae bacterium]
MADSLMQIFRRMVWLGRTCISVKIAEITGSGLRIAAPSCLSAVRLSYKVKGYPTVAAPAPKSCHDAAFLTAPALRLRTLAVSFPQQRLGIYAAHGTLRHSYVVVG